MSNHPFNVLSPCYSPKQWYIGTNMRGNTVMNTDGGIWQKNAQYIVWNTFEGPLFLIYMYFCQITPLLFYHGPFFHNCTNISLFQGKAGRSNIEGIIWQKICFIKNKGLSVVLQIMYYDNFSIYYNLWHRRRKPWIMALFPYNPALILLRGFPKIDLKKKFLDGCFWK